MVCFWVALRRYHVNVIDLDAKARAIKPKSSSSFGHRSRLWSLVTCLDLSGFTVPAPSKNWLKFGTYRGQWDVFGFCCINAIKKCVFNPLVSHLDVPRSPPWLVFCDASSDLGPSRGQWVFFLSRQRHQRSPLDVTLVRGLQNIFHMSSTNAVK